MLPDFGWSELLVVAIVLIVIVGPKDLPRMLRSFGKTTAGLRKMAGDFRRQFDEALKDAELDDVRQVASDLKGLDPRNKIKDSLNPLGKVGQELSSDLKKTAADIDKSGKKAFEKPKTDTAKSSEPASQKANDPEPVAMTETTGKTASKPKTPAKPKTAANPKTTSKTTAKTASRAKTAAKPASSARTTAKTAAAKSATGKATTSASTSSRSATTRSASTKSASAGKASTARSGSGSAAKPKGTSGAKATGTRAKAKPKAAAKTTRTAGKEDT